MEHIYRQDIYVIEQNQFDNKESEIWIYNEKNKLLFYCIRNNYGPNNDIRVYRDERRHEELLNITKRHKSDQFIYDVYDIKEKKRIGALQAAKDMASSFYYHMFDENNKKIGTIKENNIGINTIKKHLSIFPQRYDMRISDRKVATLKQSCNPLSDRLSIDFSAKPHTGIDKRIPIATSIVVSINDGKKNIA